MKFEKKNSKQIFKKKYALLSKLLNKMITQTLKEHKNLSYYFLNKNIYYNKRLSI